MNFSNLTTNEQCYTTAIVLIGFIALILATITNITITKDKKSIFILSFLLVVIIIDLSVLIELLNFSLANEQSISPKADGLIYNFPYSVHIVLGLVSILIAIYNIYKAYKTNNDNITNFSFKEALESLPTGIVFISESNNIYLSNHIMCNLCKELTGKDLISGIDIWEELCKLRRSDKCVINEDNPAFMLQNGKIWQFVKTTLKEQIYYEIKATDITELYNLRKNAEDINATLQLQQLKLEALSNMIEENTEKEIAVNLKVNFHDRFGSLLAQTKQTLMETEFDETKVLAEHWAEFSSIFSTLPSNDMQSLSLPQVQTFGKKLGCEVMVNGYLPNDDKLQNTFLLCINEALINAYRHSKAHILQVEITQTEESAHISIHSETKIALSKITEGGGLTGLRQRVEQLGGKFDIDTKNGVTIKVTLNKSH